MKMMLRTPYPSRYSATTSRAKISANVDVRQEYPEAQGTKGTSRRLRFRTLKKNRNAQMDAGERVRMAVSAVSSRSNMASMEIQCEICII